MPHFCDDPASYHGAHVRPMQRMAPSELEREQLAALNDRFIALRGRIASLRAMAERLGIDRIEAIEDVVPLLFPHSFYKAYPDRGITGTELPGQVQ